MTTSAQNMIFDMTFEAIAAAKDQKDLYERLDSIFKKDADNVVDPNLCGYKREKGHGTNLVRMTLLYAIIQHIDDPFLLPTVGYLLNIKANPNFCVQKSETNESFICPPPLYAAITRSHLSVIKCLIAFGAEVNYVKPILCSPMYYPNYVHLAVNNALESKISEEELQNRLQILQILFENKAIVEFNNLYTKNSPADKNGETKELMAVMRALESRSQNKLAVLRCLLPYSPLWRSTKMLLKEVRKNRSIGRYETFFGNAWQFESVLGFAYRLMQERHDEIVDQYGILPMTHERAHLIASQKQPYTEAYKLILEGIKNCITKYAQKIVTRINNEEVPDEKLSIDQYKKMLRAMTMTFAGMSQIPDILEAELEEQVYQAVLLEVAKKYKKEIPEFEQTIKEHEIAQAKKEAARKEAEFDNKVSGDVLKLWAVSFNSSLSWHERLQKIKEITQKMNEVRNEMGLPKRTADKPLVFQAFDDETDISNTKAIENSGTNEIDNGKDKSDCTGNDKGDCKDNSDNNTVTGSTVQKLKPRTASTV